MDKNNRGNTGVACLGFNMFCPCLNIIIPVNLIGIKIKKQNEQKHFSLRWNECNISQLVGPVDVKKMYRYFSRNNNILFWGRGNDITSFTKMSIKLGFC